MKKLIFLSIAICCLVGCSNADKEIVLEENTANAPSIENTSAEIEPETIIVEVEKEVIVEVPVEIEVTKEIIFFKNIRKAPIYGAFFFYCLCRKALGIIF